jgi:hypothetical protein
MFQTILQCGVYMADIAVEEFALAKEYLEKKFEELKSLKALVNQKLRDLQPRTGWSLINELIQNAIDLKATEIKFTLFPNGDLQFQHDARIQEYPLNQRAIIGLCTISESTKGLDTVGFMGIGFKFFTKFFSSVDVSDGTINFRINYPSTGNWEAKIRKLHTPELLESKSEIEDGYSTSFKFHGSLEDVRPKIAEVFKNQELENFTLYVKNGLSKIIFEDRSDEEEISIDEIIGNYDGNNTIKISKGEESIQNYVIGESMTASEEGKQFVVNKRSVELKFVKENKVNRTVSLVVRLEEQDNKIIPKPRTGRLFCLVPLTESKFPFDIGLDADWFMDAERKSLELDSEAKKWHSEMIIPTLPLLIEKFLLSIESSISADFRKKCTDIFPSFRNSNYYEKKENMPGRIIMIEDQFDFLDSDDFKSRLSEILFSTPFLLNTGGQVVCPKDVKMVEEKSGGERKYNSLTQKYQDTEEMNQEVYKQFLQCFNTPLVDRYAISYETIEYLEYLDLLEYPDISDVNVVKIRELWDPKRPSDYLHVLDILSSTWGAEGESLGVIPLKNGNWAGLFDENIVFEKLPSEPNEIYLHNYLNENNSKYKSLTEIHNSLQQGIKTCKKTKDDSWGDASGNTWKEIKIREENSFFDSTTKISEEVSNIVSQDKNLVDAILHYTLRTNQPTILKQISTETGISKPEDCIIPEPYANNKLVVKNRGLELSKSTKQILLEYSEDVNVREFLDSAKLINMVPTEKKTVARKPKTILRKTGIKVGFDGPHKSTLHKKTASDKGGWTIINWVWPLGLSEFTTESLSEYFCEPSDELQKSMNKDGKNVKIGYFYIKARAANGNKDTEWIKELKSQEWVLCTDENIRKPSSAPIESTDTVQYQAKLSENIVNFYINLGIKFESSLDDLSNEDCFEHWKFNVVKRPQLFLSKLKSLESTNEEKLSVALETIWPTNGEVFQSTKLKNFVSSAGKKLGGYVGDIALLDEDLTEYLKGLGHQFPRKIISDTIIDCISQLNKQFKTRESQNTTTVLQTCWSLLAANKKISTNLLSVLNSQYDVVDIMDKTFYLHPFPEDRRFEQEPDFLAYEQFPASLSILYSLSNSISNFEIIDERIDGIPDEETLERSLHLQMLFRSMGLHIDIYLVDKNHTWTNQGNPIEIDILVKLAPKSTKIYLRQYSEEKWVDDLVSLITEQKPRKFGKSRKSIRELINNYNTVTKFFVALYHGFCKKMNLEIYSDTDFDITQSEVQTKSPEKMKQSQPAKLRFAEERIEKQPSNANKVAKKEEEKTSKKSEVSKTTTTLERDYIQDEKTSRTQIFSDKEIGDRAQDIVVEYLREERWNVNDSNDENQDNEGFDLLAQKDGITRYIEVKGVRSSWTSVQMSHQQGLHFFKTVLEDDAAGKFEYWLCIVENILNEDQTEISEESPDLHCINLSREKPKHMFNSGQWATRKRPDTDF